MTEFDTIKRNISRSIKIQQRCIARYLENYSLTNKGEKAKMKIAIGEIKKECPVGMGVMFPYTPEPINVWIDRVNVERARREMENSEKSLYEHIPEQEMLL